MTIIIIISSTNYAIIFSSCGSSQSNRLVNETKRAGRKRKLKLDRNEESKISYQAQ